MLTIFATTQSLKCKHLSNLPAERSLILLNLETLLDAVEYIHRFFVICKLLFRVSLLGLVTLWQISFPNRPCVFHRRRLSLIKGGFLRTLKFSVKIRKSAANIPSQITAPFPKNGILCLNGQLVSIDGLKAEVI